MTLSIEALKRFNLVDFLSEHYHLRFQTVGGEYVCHSPFTEEETPSFFVRLVDGRWLFKDFSSGYGGSIFDFVRASENLARFSDALSYIRRLLLPMSSSTLDADRREEAGGGELLGDIEKRSYDIDLLYKEFKGEDISVCRDYLIDRGISGELTGELTTAGILLHNRYKGHSYCCFAVLNSKGELQCLDNHQVDGPSKFVLGCKSIFTLDWGSLPTAETVFICEGIIDYLSIKTLEDDSLPGLALLGNDVSSVPTLLLPSTQIISALDDDRGGYSGYLDLREAFPDAEIKAYDLEDHKDPNELLVAVKSGKGRKLSPERKLKLYQEFLKSSNRAELARKWGVDRSYMYEVARECEETLLDTFSGRKPGRRPEGKPKTLEEAWERIKALEDQYESEAAEREFLYCRSEFLKLRLKWADIEVASLCGEPVDDAKGAVKKKQVKKKRRKRL